MRLLERYIRGRIVIGTILALAVIVTLVVFLSLVEELKDVGRGQYRIVDAILFVSMLVPQQAYQVFPVSALIGSLLGLGQMANHSELTAMRSAGVSMASIVAVVLKTGLYMLLVALFVGEVIAPYGDQWAQQMRAKAISEQVTLKTRYGFWARDGASFVNIRQILPGTGLRDIFIYDFNDDRELEAVTYAASAKYQKDAWLLRDISKTRIHPEGAESERLAEATWESLLDPAILSVVLSRPQTLPAWGLYNYISYMRDNGLDSRTYEVAFWSKIVTPVVTLIMLFLSVPFVFGSLRSVGIGQRVFTGVILGMSFLLLNQAVGQIAVVYEINPLLAVSFPALLFLGLAIWFVRRVY